MLVIDSEKNIGALVGKAVGGILLIPFVAMVCAGTLAHHHRPMLDVIFQFSYLDWVLANFVLSMIRGYKVSKWYLKTEDDK